MTISTSASKAREELRGEPPQTVDVTMRVIVDLSYDVSKEPVLGFVDDVCITYLSSSI